MEIPERAISIEAASTTAQASDPLRAPFEPVMLRRPLPLFGLALGLIPGATAAPKTEIVLRLITGHESEKALIRDALRAKDPRNLEKNFKNFENLREGRDTTLRVFEELQVALDRDASGLRALADGQLVDVFVICERAANSCFSAVTSKPVHCRHCKADQMADTDIWLNQQPVRLGPSERRFIDRLLTALVGASLLGEMFMPDSAPFDATLLLIDSKRHPIGNWLKWLQQQCGCTKLDELHAKLARKHEHPVSGRQLEKYSSGQDLMPFRAAEQLITLAPDSGVARALLIAARTLTLAVDFICAVAEECDVSRETAQGMVDSRLRGLQMKARIGEDAAFRELKAVEPEAVLS